MTFSLRQVPVRIRLGLLALAPILLLCALCVFFPPDGLERTKWAQFVGRFHLLTVHFPIALILLIPVLELAGRKGRLPHLSASVDFILALATLSSLVAVALGWCLARSGGYSGRLVTQHMWGGISVAASCWLCWMLRGYLAGARFDLIYTLWLLARIVDGVSRRPTIARRKSPHRTNADWTAQADWAFSKRSTSAKIRSCLFLRCACRIDLRRALLFLPRPGEAEISLAAG
jgi:uncharacterized membrane protein